MLPSLVALGAKPGLAQTKPNQTAEPKKPDRPISRKKRGQREIHLPSGERFWFLWNNCSGFVQAVFAPYVSCTATSGVQLPKLCKAESSAKFTKPSEAEIAEDTRILLAGHPSSIRNAQTLLTYIESATLARAYVLVRTTARAPDSSLQQHALVGLIFESKDESDPPSLLIGRYPKSEEGTLCGNFTSFTTVPFCTPSILVLGDSIRECTRERFPHILRFVALFKDADHLGQIKSNLVGIIRQSVSRAGGALA
jgi:hypothetical protein